MHSDGRARPAGSTSLLAAAWLLVMAGVTLLVLRLEHLPDTIPLYRSFTGTPTSLAPKSALAVLRVPLMGASQLVTVSLLARQAQRDAVVRCSRFLPASACTTGVKT